MSTAITPTGAAPLSKLQSTLQRFGADSAADVSPTTDADVVTITPTTHPNAETTAKPGLLSRLLMPFTKIGQVVTGLFRTIGGWITGAAKGVGAMFGHLFNRGRRNDTKSVTTPQVVTDTVPVTIPEVIPATNVTDQIDAEDSKPGIVTEKPVA